MVTLVTGGAGYIGSHCVLALLERGEKVFVLDNLSTGFRDAVHAPAQLIVGDVGNKQLASAIIKEEGVDAIIHLAASTIVPESLRSPLLYYQNNTANSRTLIEAAIEGGVKKFIFSSTAAVYGSTGETPVPETHRLAPLSPYGMSKVMAEQILIDAAAASDLRYVILRYFNVAGADPKGRAGQSTLRATHLIKVAAQAVLSPSGAITVFGHDYPTKDGTCVRDFIHVTDLAEAHISALDYLNGSRSDTFNCGYGHGSSVLEVIAAVEEVAGRKLDVQFGERRPGDAASVVADNAKILGAFSWRPRYDDLKTIVADALSWEKILIRIRQAA
jgi:UDP-glucose 4-epimerase